MGLVRTRLLLALFPPLVLVPPPCASAQSHDVTRAIQVAYDNDLLSLRGRGKPPDFDYTSGAQMSVIRATAPRWVHQLTRRADDCHIESHRKDGCVASSFALNHQIYTPRENSAEPVPGQRPYAGWLSGQLGVTLARQGRSRSFGVEGGVTGPLSFAERVQNGMHGLMHTRQQLGWKNQLPNAAGVVLRYEEGQRFETATRRTFASADVHWGAATGNIVNAMSFGTDVSVGLRGALPWSPAEPRVARPARAFMTFGYQQDVVLHSVLIDGRGSVPGATRRPLVGQLEAGIGFRNRLFGMVYRHIVRDREYEAQPSRHAYGSITLSATRF